MLILPTLLLTLLTSSVSNTGIERLPVSLARMVSYYGFSPNEFRRVWDRESDFRDDVVGKDGEIGRAQVKLSTARIYYPRISKSELKDSVLNTLAAIKHLSSLRTKLKARGYRGERLKLMTYSAYNRGMGKVLGDLKNGRNPINGYARYVVGKRK